ncbi:MAG: DUF2867 domain-containing protein [Bacteroidota bacterium]
MKPYEIDIPSDALARQALKKVDYQDAYAIQLPLEQPVDPKDMVLLFFDCIPSWFGVLIAIRQLVAGWMGLKTGEKSDFQESLDAFQGQPGESIAMFHVLDRTEEELLMGENDRHLDFRLAFVSKKMEKGSELSLVTTVQFNNWLGKLYFIPVGPVHRLIVPILLRRMARRLLATHQGPATK